MAIINCIDDPIMRSTAQVFVLPVNSTGKILDSVVARSKTLFPDNYQTYRRQCIEGKLHAGMSLLVKRQRDKAGLASSSNGDNPSYIANLVVSDHPYHPPRLEWLDKALTELYPQAFDLVRFHGVRHIALLIRPLLYPQNDGEISHLDKEYGQDIPKSAELKASVLSWQEDIYPLIEARLNPLPNKLRIDLHVPHELL